MNTTIKSKPYTFDLASRKGHSAPQRNPKRRSPRMSSLVDLSVIIPARNELLLRHTCESVRRALPTAELIVIDDGTTDMATIDGVSHDVMIRRENSIGLANARHVGLLRAANDVCLLLDAHCTLPVDPARWQSIIAYHHDHPNVIACFLSLSLGDDLELEHATGVYRAAYVIDRLAFHRTGRAVLFPSRWADVGCRGEAATPGRPLRAASCLGGQYMMHRQWYQRELQGVWEHNKAWGTSEQTVCVPHRMVGGECAMWDWGLGHYYRSGTATKSADLQRVPYETLLGEIIYNQLRLARLLQLSPRERDERYRWLCQYLTEAEVRPALKMLLKTPRIELNYKINYAEYLDRHSKPWERD